MVYIPQGSIVMTHVVPRRDGETFGWWNLVEDAQVTGHETFHVFPLELLKVLL